MRLLRNNNLARVRDAWPKRPQRACLLGIRTVNRPAFLTMFDHHDCREEIGRYQESPKTLIGLPDVACIAFVEMPPYAGWQDTTLSAKTACSVGKLSDGREWLVQTPDIMTRLKGNVTKVRQGQSAEKSLSMSDKPLFTVSPITLNLGRIAMNKTAEGTVFVHSVSHKPLFLNAKRLSTFQCTSANGAKPGSVRADKIALLTASDQTPGRPLKGTIVRFERWWLE